MHNVPEGTAAMYPIAPPNRPTRVYKGRLQAKPGRLLLTRSRLDYHWGPRAGLWFRGTVRGHLGPDDELSHVRAPKNGAWVETLLLHSQLGKSPHVEGVFQNCVRIGPNRPVHAVLFHIPNFHSYVGDRVRFDRMFTRGRLVLSAGEWVATIDQSSRDRELLKALKTHGGYAVAHAGLITHADKSRFRIEQIGDFWSSLHFFLTFARGNWCGPIIPVGMGRRGALWTEWCNWRIRPWTGVRSWFPQLAEQTQQAFAGFHTLWSDPVWNEPLRDLVNWYVEANLNAGAVEGSIILAHTGLDLLSWMRLVQQKSTYSPKVFKKLPADERFRLVLADLGIPGDIPVSFANAHALATSKKLKDGPELINQIRNAIVHPTPGKRAFLAKVPDSCRIEVLQLALHYLELGILAICEYQGQYVTRLMPGAWAGQATLKVPWETATP